MANNPRLGIPVNLPQGATYDVLLVDTPSGYPEGQLFFRFVDTPRKITGIQKVAQLFLKVLLTTKGSDVLNTFLGTTFPDLAINANRTGTDQNLYTEIILAVKDAENQSKSVLNLVTSDIATQLDSVNILGLDTSQESITMFLQLKTVAGEVAQVAVPFPELDMTMAQV